MRSLRLLRPVNPLVRLVLRSPAHRVLSGSLALLEYRGRRSGKGYAIPVMYADAGSAVVVLAARPAAKMWWRTFSAGAPATLLIGGDHRAMLGSVASGPGRRDALRAYLDRFPRARSALDVPADPTDDALDAADAVIVVFTSV